MSGTTPDFSDFLSMLSPEQECDEDALSVFFDAVLSEWVGPSYAFLFGCEGGQLQPPPGVEWLRFLYKYNQYALCNTNGGRSTSWIVCSLRAGRTAARVGARLARLGAGGAHL